MIVCVNFSYRSYSTLSIASSRSSLASDIHDISTPAPSSPVVALPPDVKDMPPASSTPIPPENSIEGHEKRHSRSPTPQPQIHGETFVEPSSTINDANPPEINIQGADVEQSTVSNPPSTTESTNQQLSLTEAGAQVAAAENSNGDVEGTKKDDDFGEFQEAEGVPEAVTGASGMEAPQVPAESSQENVQETGLAQPSALNTNLTDPATNLQAITPASAAVTGTCTHTSIWNERSLCSTPRSEYNM